MGSYSSISAEHTSSDIVVTKSRDKLWAKWRGLTNGIWFNMLFSRIYCAKNKDWYKICVSCFKFNNIIALISQNKLNCLRRLQLVSYYLHCDDTVTQDSGRVSHGRYPSAMLKLDLTFWYRLYHWQHSSLLRDIHLWLTVICIFVHIWLWCAAWW